MCALSSRLLQKTQDLLSRCCQVSLPVLVVLLTVALLNFVLPEPAQAATLDWRSAGVEWTSGTASGANQIFPNTGTNGNSGVRVRLTLTDPNGITVDLGDPPPDTGLDGGATPESTLLALINSAVRGQAIQLRFDYLDPADAPVPVENARFVIVDIDSSNGVAGTGGVWQDEIVAEGQAFAGGAVTPTLFAWPTAATADPNFDGLLSVNPGGGIFPPTTDADYTVQTPFLPQPPATPLPPPRPNPEIIPGNTATARRLENADNDTPNGSVLAAYSDTIQSSTFTYRSGALAANNPGQQGIGFYNVFFDPVAIGTSKQVTNVVDNGNGTYTITYQVVVENMGGVELRNVQLTEDLSTTFTAPATFNVTDIRLVGTTRAGAPAPDVNTGFTGTGANTNLLDGVGTLLPRELDLNNNQTAAGGTATVQFDVLVTPNGNLGPFNNQVQASGTSPNGQTVTDDSVDGADPDPNGDGSAIESSPTPVTLVTAPRIGVSKGVASIAFEPTGAFGAGTARATYDIVVRNLGGEALNNVQMVENLNTTFGAGNFAVNNLTRTAGVATVAPNFPGVGSFNGDTNQNLLAAGGTLAIGAEATFQLVVDINTASGTLPAQPFQNQVTAAGVGATSGGNTTDLSNDVGSVPAGTDPIDPNGDGNPSGAGEDTPTGLTIPALTPRIGVSKGLASVSLVGANTARATYNIVVRNLGNEALNNVQMVENLNTTFGAGNFAINNLTRTAGVATVAPNFPGVGSFNGDTNQNLLAAGGTLAVGAEATFQLVVDINAASGTLPAQPFENQVEATGVGAISGGTTNDLSNDAGSVPAGTDPIDPDGDGNPNEAGENTVTPLTFTLTPDVRLVKRITAVTRGGAPVAIAGINGFNDQPGDVNDNQLQQLSNSSLPLGVFNIAGGTLQTGDVLEYTIYVWNNGLNQADNVQICDEIQPPSQLDNTSLSFAPASAFPTLAAFGGAGPLSAANAGDVLSAFCPSAPGNFPTGGGVLLDPGGGFNLPSRQVAAIRFRVNIP
jgi:uncharacterized repeat protein (TIGR01451 family)